MTNTLPAGEALMKSPAAHLHHGATWHNQCASFVDAMVSGLDSTGSAIGPSRNTAREALAASGPIISADGSKAAPGDVGWWSNGSTGDGHVAVYIGKGLWAMGSDAVTQGGTTWGADSGVITLARYAALKPSMRWVGFTHDYVGQKFKPVPAAPAAVYVTVTAGMTLTRIAAAHGITLARIEQLNPGIRNPNVISIGQKVRVR